MINMDTTGMSEKKANTDMSITWKVGTPQRDGAKAQKSLRTPSPAPVAYWEKHQARVNRLLKGETWGSSDSDHESESYGEELPWTVVPAKVDAPRTANQKQVRTKSNDITEFRPALLNMSYGARFHCSQTWRHPSW